MKYQDFVVRIGRSPEGHLRARVLRSPAGEGELSVALPEWLDPAALARAASPPGGNSAVDGEGTVLFRDLARRSPPSAVTDEKLGRRLHEMIFSGVIGRLWDQSLGSVSGHRDTGLRLRLQIDLGSAELLADLPWELLRSGDTGAYLSLDRRTPVLRHLEVAQPVSPQALPTSLKVLGVAAAPRELAFLDLATEKQKLEAGKKSRRWQLGFLAQPTVELLRQELVGQGSHVLHFMGHGDFDPQTQEGALYFEDGEGNAAPFTGSALAATLTGLPALRLVVLNACQTAVSGGPGSGNAYGGVAAALVRGGVPAVIAMQQPISDAAAIAFSSAFYRHLAAGADLEEALTEGRQAIHTANPASFEWSIPVLFARTAERGLFIRPEESAALRYRWLATAAAAVLLSLSLPPVREVLFGQKAYMVDLEQILATGVDGLKGRLVAVEILEDGHMRLHFSFENQTDRVRTVGFDFEKTYLADENGNAYEVKASSSPIAGGRTVPALSESIPAGESREYWVEFQAPQDGARRLHVELATPQGSEAKFLPFEVSLPSYPKELSVPSTPAPRYADSDALQLEVGIENGRKDVSSQVRRLEVSEHGMRLSFDMWNRGSLPLAADFDPSRIEFRDGQGNVLRPVRMGTFENGRELDLKVDSLLRRAVRTRVFIDFPPPKTASKRWELRLATRPGSEFRFAGAALQLTDSIFERARRKIEEFARQAKPKLQAQPRVDPPPTKLLPPPPVAEEAEAASPPAVAAPEARFEEQGEGQEVKTSRAGLKARITGIERLNNQRLRFVLEVTNVGAESEEVGLRLAGTKLSDDQGRQFRLLASTFGEVGAGGQDDVRFTVAPGTARGLVFEFSGRVQGSEIFTLVLGSANPDLLRFLPTRIQLPPE